VVFNVTGVQTCALPLFAGVGGEALAAAAGGRGVGVVEHEFVVQAPAHEVDRGAVHHRQAVRVDMDADPVLHGDRIPFAGLAGDVHHVAPAGTTGAFDAEAQAQGVGHGGEEPADPLQGGGSGLDGHARDSGPSRLKPA